MATNLLVLQTDFGLQDGAVAAMYGVALGASKDLKIYNLTHEIEAYNIWEGSYRLVQTIQYWPEGTVFVSVVDPGVGSKRKSIVAKTKDGHYIVTPDNGTLTHLQLKVGIEEIREIDEKVNRLPFSGDSYTFHGRDIYAYTGARLAAGVISYEEVGPEVAVKEMTLLPTEEVVQTTDYIEGMIDILDVRFGNVWTNISREQFLAFGIQYDDTLAITVSFEDRIIYNNQLKFVTSFAKVNIGEPMSYVNSLDLIGVGINQGSFAKAFQVAYGHKWKIKFEKIS